MNSTTLSAKERTNIWSEFNSLQQSVFNRYTLANLDNTVIGKTFVGEKMRWQLTRVNIDYNFERRRKSRNTMSAKGELRCFCNKLLKYQFELTSLSANPKKMFLGYACFSRHAGIPLSVAAQLRNHVDKAEEKMNYTLYWYSHGERFPSKIFDALISSNILDSYPNFAKKMRDFYKADFPLSQEERDRLTEYNQVFYLKLGRELGRAKNKKEKKSQNQSNDTFTHLTKVINNKIKSTATHLIRLEKSSKETLTTLQDIVDRIERAIVKKEIDPFTKALIIQGINNLYYQFGHTNNRSNNVSKFYKLLIAEHIIFKLIILEAMAERYEQMPTSTKLKRIAFYSNYNSKSSRKKQEYNHLMNCAQGLAHDNVQISAENQELITSAYSLISEQKNIDIQPLLQINVTVRNNSTLGLQLICPPNCPVFLVRLIYAINVYTGVRLLKNLSTYDELIKLNNLSTLVIASMLQAKLTKKIDMLIKGLMSSLSWKMATQYTSTEIARKLITLSLEIRKPFIVTKNIPYQITPSLSYTMDRIKNISSHN